MSSGNALHRAPADADSASGNGDRPRLPGPYDAVLLDYAAALERAPLAPSSRRKYLSRARGFLAWLASTAGDGDPLGDAAARDWAVRDYRSHLKTVRRAAPAAARREDLPATRAPRALGEREARRYLRAVETGASARDRVVALLPYYAGLRDSEVVRLDVGDARLSARKGELEVLGKGADGGKQRTLPVHAELRSVLQAWLQVRPTWPGADSRAALVLNQRGGRLSDRSVRTIVGRFGELAGLGDDPLDPFGPHVLRHTFGTQLVRAGVDLVTVAELMGHSRLETTRLYTLPTRADRERALDALLTDR